MLLSLKAQEPQLKRLRSLKSNEKPNCVVSERYPYCSHGTLGTGFLKKGKDNFQDNTVLTKHPDPVGVCK